MSAVSGLVVFDLFNIISMTYQLHTYTRDNTTENETLIQYVRSETSCRNSGEEQDGL
jgi:hypothetical protein